MKVLMIGAGHMGATYAEGMAQSPFFKGEPLEIFDKDLNKVKELDEKDYFNAYERLEDCLPGAQIVFIAVKPPHAATLFKEMQPYIKEDQVFVSIMAGVTLQTLEEGLNAQKIIRAMPNLPAQVGLGATALTETKAVTSLELSVVHQLMNMTGVSVHVEGEKFIDAATGISGSGPAYVFYFMQSMVEAAEEMGFSRKDAFALVGSTFEGSARLFSDNDLAPEEWVDRVATKGGTTRAAIDKMINNGVKEKIKAGAFSSFERAVELGKNS